MGTIDAHQIPHSLIWRAPEREVSPTAAAHGIGVVAYGAMGYGILTGKFSRRPDFSPQDDRSHRILFFQEPTWGAIYAAVEQMKALAQDVRRPMQHLALRWSLAQPGMVCALAGANSPAQVAQNPAALEGEIPAWALERLTEISDALQKEIPAEANPYGYRAVNSAKTILSDYGLISRKSRAASRKCIAWEMASLASSGVKISSIP